jgi:hypothetical protein
MSLPIPAPGRDRWFGWAAAALLLAVVLTLTAVGVAVAGPGSQAPPDHAGPQPVRTAAIGAKDAVPIAGALTARITGIAAVQGAAVQPGEIAGPAIRVGVRIINGTGSAMDLTKTVVNATYGADRTPAAALSSGGVGLPASLAPGKAATGQFVFTVPPSERRTVEVTVDTAVSNPIVAFRGSAPN